MSNDPIFERVIAILAKEYGLDDTGDIELPTQFNNEFWQGPISLKTIGDALEQLSVSELEQIVLEDENDCIPLYDKCERLGCDASMLRAFLDDLCVQVVEAA